MSKAEAVHHIVLELEPPLSPEVPVGSELSLKVKASCSCGCDLSGVAVSVVADGTTLVTHELVSHDSETQFTETDTFIVKAPNRVGSHDWLLQFQEKETDAAVHPLVSLPLSFLTKAHETSLAVWDVSSPVIAGQPFTIKVGAKSSSACALHGAAIEIRDDTGAVVANGRLGETPLEGTTALYWTEIALTAPEREVVATWSARFAGAETALPHNEGMASFSFASVKPPEHTLTVRLIDEETQQPIQNAQVRLGVFRGVTGASGLAELSVPKGKYELKVWHASYDASPLDVEVNDDVTVQLHGVAVPEDNPTTRFWS